MRRQTGIVVGFLDEILGSRALVVEPHQRIQCALHVGHENPVGVLGRVEQLILLRLRGVLGFRRLFIAQRQEPAGLAPPLRLIEELALAVGIGQRRTLPLRRLQLVYKSRGLARHHDESPLQLLVGFNRLPAVEARIGPCVHDLHCSRQTLGNAFQMFGDLLAAGPVAAAQRARRVLPRLGDKAQDGLIAPLSLVLRVVALAPAHGMPTPSVCCPLLNRSLRGSKSK